MITYNDSKTKATLLQLADKIVSGFGTASNLVRFMSFAIYDIHKHIINKREIESDDAMWAMTMIMQNISEAWIDAKDDPIDKISTALFNLMRTHDSEWIKDQFYRAYAAHLLDNTIDSAICREDHNLNQSRFNILLEIGLVLDELEEHQKKAA
ncbi:MAG: hypothetical protein JNL51_05100 [Chitinophagaceae bacterium]|nr:hypothetical protein [Chitinophagaceae bacterium]